MQNEFSSENERHEKLKIWSDFRIFERESPLCSGLNETHFTKSRKSLLFLMDTDGFLIIFDTRRNKILKKKRIPLMDCIDFSSYMTFSPDGSRFLTSVFSDRKIQVFSTYSLNLLETWSHEEAWAIGKSKWIDNETILAPFGYPGELVIIKFGEKKSISKVQSPSLNLSEFWLSSVEVFPSKKEAVVAGGDSFLVLKMSLSPESQGVIWTHTAHWDFVETVRLSNSGKLVVSGGLDLRVVIANEEDGSVLGIISGFAGDIFGLDWSPDDQTILATSRFEITQVLFNNGTMLKRKNLIDKETIGKNEMAAVHIFWEKIKAKKALVGTQAGRLLVMK